MNAIRRADLVCGAFVALILALLAMFVFAREPVYAFDGFAYGVRAQLDAGISYPQAIANARAVYALKPAMKPWRSRRWLSSPVPQWWNLFRVRPVYPWFGSLFWRQLDFGALFAVSLGAYVLAGVLTYGMLLRFTRPEFAACIALLIGVFPESRLYARDDLTDMTAYALLVATLWAMMRYVQSRTPRDFAVALFCAIVLSFTRPVPYIIVCAALPLIFSRYRRSGVLLGLVGLTLCAVVEIVMIVSHAENTVATHYFPAVRMTSLVTADWWYTHPAGLIALWALIVKRREPEALLALGAWGSIVPTLLLNPIPGDVPRVILLPSFVSLACGLGYTAQIFSRAYRATTAAHPSGPRDRNTQRHDDHPLSGTRTNVS